MFELRLPTGTDATIAIIVDESDAVHERIVLGNASTGDLLHRRGWEFVPGADWRRYGPPSHKMLARTVRRLP